MRIGRLPSPATVIALLALIVAVAGTAYAVEKISGKQIQNRSIKGKKLKKNTVKGKEIKEASLGTVPRATQAAQAAQAAHATDAAQAANAATLGGLGPDAFVPTGKVRTFQARAAIGATNVDVASLGPFRLVGSCGLSGGSQLQPRLTAQTTDNDSVATASQFTPSDDALYEGDADFDVGDSLEVIAYQEASPISLIFGATARLASPGGVSVTADLTTGSRVFSNNPSEQAGCFFAGSAIVDGG